MSEDLRVLCKLLNLTLDELEALMDAEWESEHA
jgi:hypothetical protein